MVEWIIVIAIIVIGLVVCFLSWIDYKRDKDIPKAKQDPIVSSAFTALLLTFVIVLLVYFGESFGTFEPGFTRSKFYIFLAFFFIVFFIGIWSRRKLKPRSIPWLERRATEYIEFYLPSEKYSAEGRFPDTYLARVDADAGLYHTLVTRQDIKADAPISLLITLDIYTGYLANYQYNPERDKVARIFEIVPRTPKAVIEEALEEKEGEDYKER